MEAACEYLIGAHDYRNFCKINMSTAKHHLRRILKASVKRSSINAKLAILEITSTGFLYHQIRITMTILLHIGMKNERPEIILDLLDFDKYPKRPQLCMASDLPLVLTKIEFCEEDAPVWELYEKGKLLDHFSKLWFEKMVEAQMIEILIKEQGFEGVFNDDRMLLLLSADFKKNIKSKRYVKFKDRGVCPSLEEELDKEERRLKRKEGRKNEFNLEKLLAKEVGEDLNEPEEVVKHFDLIFNL